MMFFGRMLGWVMVLAGVGLLVRYFSEWMEAGSAIPMAISDLWSSDRLMAAYTTGSALDTLTAVMLSGPAAALLIILGILLVWGCRTGPLRE